MNIKDDKTLAVTGSSKAEANLEWGDVRQFYHFAWKTFTRKVAISWTMVATAMTILSFTFSATIPDPYKRVVVIFSAVVLTLLIIITLVLGIGGLLVERRELIKDNEKAWSSVKSLNAEKEALTTKPKSHQALWSQGAQLYGLAFYKMHVHVVVAPDGSFKTDFDLEFAATNEAIDVIERFAWVSQGDLEKDYKLSAKEATSAGVKITPGAVQTYGREQVWSITTVPALPQGKRVAYQYSEYFPPNSIAMTHEKMLMAGLRWEFYSIRVAHPTEKFKLTVTLPKEFSPRRNDFDVWYTHRMQVKHNPECQRVFNDEGWKPRWTNENKLVLELEVDYPIHGLSYSVKWQPPMIWSVPGA